MSHPYTKSGMANWRQVWKINILFKFKNQITCLQLVRKTRIFELRCAFMKLHNMSNFCSRGTIIAVCCKRLGVAVTDSSCTLRYSGSFKLSLARSWTDFVWVAEKRKVCLCFGSCETIAFKAFLNPTSRIRSASSRIKICSPARNFHSYQQTNKQNAQVISKEVMNYNIYSEYIVWLKEWVKKAAVGQRKIIEEWGILIQRIQVCFY